MSQTPECSTAKGTVGITQREKQALIDDLQLEITERARKLRAQYALQAQGLRTRLEMRVNRIPQALRKRTMQDLIDEHTTRSKPAPPAPAPAAPKARPAQADASAQVQTLSKRPSKRKSDEISTGDDKENVPSRHDQDLDNPKKRTKTTGVVANSKATRTASRKAGPAGVLSPKSHNSRTYPQSPLKPSTLAVTQSSAPATKTSTRAPSRQTKRTVAPPEAESRTSGASDSSAGTTIITKPGTKKPPVPKRSGPTKTASSTTGRKPATARRDMAQAPPIVGRTLRKRN